MGKWAALAACASAPGEHGRPISVLPLRQSDPRERGTLPAGAGQDLQVAPLPGLL